MEDKLLGLYNDFKNAGLFKDTKDYGTFRQRMQGQGYQAQIYKVAKQNGADVGQFWQFQRNFGLGRWAGGSRQSVHPTKPLTTAQRAGQVAQEYKKKLQQKSGAYKEGANFVQANGYEGEGLGDLIGDAWEGVKSVGRKIGNSVASHIGDYGGSVRTAAKQVNPNYGAKPSKETHQVLKNWDVLTKKDSQLTPAERAVASNMRTRMQRAQEQSARQEQQRTTPITRSRITPGAKDYNETMQQLSTPEAKQARIKQQHEDDLNQMAYQGVGQNLGKDIFAMTDKAIDLAEQSSKDFFKGAEDALDFSRQYDPRVQKSIADAADMRKSTETIQRGLQIGLADKVQEYFSRPEIQKNVMDTAEKMNISLEEAVQKYYMPNLMQYAKDAVEQRQLEKVLPQGFFDYIGKNLSNSVIGMIASNALYSKEERQRRQRALAISEGLEEAPQMVGHNTDYYKAGVLSRAAGTGVNMLADSPVFGAGGTAADMAVNAGSRILARGLEKVGLKAVGKVLTPREMAFKAANMSMAQKMMSGLTTGTAKSALNLGGYSFITGGLQQISTGEDSSPAAVALAAIESGWHGAKTGAMFGFSGSVMHPWVSKYGITGLERNAEQRFIHGAQKVGATAAGLGVEAGTMMVADHLQDDKEMSFAQWLEDGVTVMAFKLGEPRNYKHVGSILHGLTHNTSKTPITLTKDERNELINSTSGKNLMDAFLDVSKASRKSPMYKSVYKDFMADPEVSRSTKEKVNAALGMPSQNYKISQRSVNDVKNKQILEYASDGTLLTRTSYKNAEERRDILYRQKTDRDNMHVLNLVGIAKLRGRQLIDDDGKVSRIAADFLQGKGYDINKEATDPKNAEMIANLQNPKHELYLDWIKYADEHNQFTGVDASINEILKKQPLKRTDEEVAKLKEYSQNLEAQLFPADKLHPEESKNQGRSIAEDNNLGTEQPNGDTVKQELNGLRQAEAEMDVLIRDNDVFGQNFKKLQEQGLTNPQIYDWMVQQGGLTVEQLAPFAQYMHANERVQGMQEATREAIDENVNTRADQWSFHGTINGNEMNGEQVLYVTDNEGRTLIVGSGEVAFDPITGRAKEDVGDMLVCLDANTRETVYLKAEDVTLSKTQNVEDFKSEDRLRLQMINSQPYNEAAQEQAILDAAKPQQEKPQDSTTKSEDSTTKEGDLTKVDTTLTKVDTTSGKDNTTNEDLAPQVQPQQEGEGLKFKDGTSVPVDANGEPDFLKMTPEQGAEVYKMLFEEDAPMQIDSDIKTLEKDLENVKASKYEGASVMERAAARKKVKEAIALAEAQVEKAKAIKAAMEKKPEAENTGVGTAENAGQYEKERQQGYREGEGGVIYHRQKPEEVGGIRGKEVTVAFSPTEKVRGHVKLVELDTVQASHNNGQLNLLHFGPDWQPKDRSSQASRVEAEKIASNIDPEQITGSNNAFIGSAPSVNERHETIQGNNRVDALKEMYASHPEQAAKYKQWLIDHAAEFGLNAEDIKKMNKPVIVNELPVDDATAKKLGQMMASGFESGGKRIPEISATINKLGDKMENLANVLLSEGTLGEDAKLSDLINQNSKRALEFLNKNGFIDNTEYENLINDVVTRRQWLESVLKSSLFDGNKKTEAAFNTLPGNAQKAVLATFMRDRKSKDEDRIKQNIQKSFEAYNELNQIAGFKNSKNLEQARAAIQAELLNGSNNVFGEAPIREKYTKFELELAALYKGLKDQKSLTGLFGKFYDAVQGKVGKELDAFSQGNAEPLGKDEAIEKVFGINNKQENDRRRETESPSKSGGGNGAEPAGDRAAGSEPERPRVEEPDDLVNKELESRIKVTDEETETPSKNGPIMKQKILIDGDKEVIKLDEPNEKGEYTGSYYEYDGKKFGDLKEVADYIDSKNEEGPLPLLPKEEKPDPTFNPIEAAAAEFKKEHPLTEDEIMKADVDDVVKDMALDYLNGEVTDDLHRAIYESIFANTRGQKTEPKVETPKTEPSADPMEGIKNAAEGFEKEKKSKTEKKPQQKADDAAVAASNKKVNDLWDMLKNAGKDEISASFIGLNSRQLEVLPKLVSAMAENAYLRIKRGMHNLEDVVKEMRKEFAPAAKLFKKEDVDAIYEQMMNIRYRDGEQRMSLKEWADYYEKTSPKHQENLVGDSKTAEERKMAEKKFIDVVNIQLGFKHKFNGIVELRKIAERLGLKDIKDTDLQELAETAIVKRARGIASSESTNNAEKFKRIKTLYENQPSLNQRDSERVMKQQYSTPAPYAFLADMYVKGNGKVIESALEPSAGNGMLTIGLPMDKVHVNDIDAQRLANLRRQGFKNVTSQDGTQPFADKDVDVVVTNPPFGSATPKEYDGYKISSLEGQMAINALESMKDDGRAAIIIGGKTEYAKNGSLNPKDKAFLGYLYSHYNVEDVINVDGGLYAKQGTSYPTRIILINGRRNYDPEHKVFPPVEKDARAEAVKDYDELYKRIEDDILRERGLQREPLGLSDRERNFDVSGDSLRQKERGGNGVTNNKEHGSGPDGGVSDLGTGGSDERPMGETERTPSEHMGDNSELESGRDSDFGADRGTGSASSRLDNGGRVPEGSVARNANETSNERGAGGDRKQQGGQGRSSSSVQRTVPTREGNGLGVKKEESPKRELSTEKVKYVPQSNNPFSLNSVIPADQARATKKALEKIGDVDNFLVDELGYNDADDMHHALASEQADSVALAIHQAKQGNAFIIGDMTGIGKGRQAAAMIRFAYKQGKIPVFITAKKALFSDMYRDLKSIGNSDLRPFIWAAKDKEHSADMTDSEGKLVYQLPSDKEQERVMDYLQKNGKLPDGYDYIVTTYDSFSSGTMDYEDGKKTVRKNGKGSKNGQRKRDVLEAIAKNANVIMDESHKAGGQGSGSAYLQYVVPKLNAITFLSATYAKRPDNMPIYALRTSMNQAGMKPSELIDAIKRGGATLQEVMSQALTASGQFIRRERDMTGVTIDWKTIDDPVVVEEQREQYDSIISLFNDIIHFQRTYVGAYLDKRNDELAAIQASIKNRQGTKDLGIHNQPFASRTYNMVQQVLLSLKAREAAKSAIEHLKNGEKVVIALNNTNESQTEQYEANAEMEAPDLGVVLMKGLQGVLRYDQTDDMGNKTFGTFNLEDLGPDAVARYHEIEENIKNASTGLSLSPIDVVRDELEAAGYRVGELTGRKTMFVKNPNGTVSKVKRTDTDKKKLALDFNTNKIDALILNRSASTGISLHDSVEYDVEHKPRTMIVVQQQPDVNEEVQMRGRIDRTGQVNRGRYEYIVSQIPSEQRLLMMFKAKLKSLDANTTSSQKSKFNDMEVSDIINKYGDKVVREYMAEHLDLYSKMADPFGWESSFGEDLSTIDPQRLIVTSGGKLGGKEAGADASKLLGRMALLRVSEQEKMLQEIGELYANEIQRLNEMGENDLEITELPLKAKTLHKEVWKQGAEPGGDNAFADNTYIEKVNMAILKKPMKASEVKASQEGLTGGKTWDEYKTEKKAAVKEYFDQKIAEASQKYEERAVKAATKAKEKYIKDAKKGQKDSGMSDEQIEKMAGYQYDNIYKQEKDKLNDVVKNLKAKAEMFERVLDTFDTNGAFVLPMDMNNPNELSGFGNSYGRLIDIKITDNYSPNASSVSFATLDGRRKITFPIAGKVGSGENKVDIIGSIDRMTKQAAGMGDSHLRVLNQNFDNWDRLTSNESRKDGYIVTGNLMQALVDSKDQGLGGQLVKYTTDTGEVKTGILMPDRFDPKGLTTDAPINSVADKFELSSWHGGIDEVTSSDGEVKVKRIDNNRGYYYELRVPKSKAKGGKYFMDEDLLKLVNGNNFETRGNNMLAEFKPEQLKPVLDRLSKMGVKVQEERKTSEDMSDAPNETSFVATGSNNRGLEKKPLLDVEPVDPVVWMREHPGQLPTTTDLFGQPHVEAQLGKELGSRVLGVTDAGVKMSRIDYEGGYVIRADGNNHDYVAQTYYPDGQIMTRTNYDIGMDGGQLKKYVKFDKNGIPYSTIDDAIKNFMENMGKPKQLSSDNGVHFREEDPQEIELPKDEYAVLAHTIDSSHKNYKRGKVNYEYTADNFYVFKYNKYNDYNVYQKIPIDGNEELINYIKDGINKETIRNPRDIDSALEAGWNGRNGHYWDSTSNQEGRGGSVRFGEVSSLRSRNGRPSDERMGEELSDSPSSAVNNYIERIAKKTGGKVKMVSSVDEITNKAAKAAIEEGRKITGWYDEKTGEVHLYMPNIHDRYTAEKTIWHEVVGHKGMRELFGDERFDKFLREVWYDLDKPENAALKKLVDEERKFNPLNIYDAIEEGIARLAEDGKGEAGFWNGIKNKVSDFLHEIGYRVAPNTKDVKYLLWLSKNLQKNPNDPYWKLRAEAVKYRLDHERMPAVVAHDGMFYGNDGKVRSMDNLTKTEWNEATDGEIHFRTTPSAGTALDRYHRSLDEHGYMLTESYMDNMLSLKKLMNAIVPDKKIEDIPSSENPYILQNTMQGAMSDAAQMFERNVMKPLDKAMADVLDAFDGKKDDEKIRNFNLYMITKHGLERNRVFFVRDFLKKMKMDEKKKQDADILENRWSNEKERLDNKLNAGNIDLKEYYRQMDEFINNEIDPDYKAGEHDYSGIHAIQEVAKSSDPYDDAEAIQSVMDSEAKMESIKKGAVKDYWDKVKAATQYSIDSDYKNNIIDKESHDYVSNMFNWYVPLRKYDEATAEDVYGYITEVGDTKNYIGSTIMRARGHKYLSETNVLAQIGAMGNRAIKNGGLNAIKMAFARFARNNSNNNLITEVSVWYEKDPMNGIVYERYPDIPEDATPDEINKIVADFNTDMKAKAAQGLASKVYRRGSIGYKFQRAENKSQHIVDVKIAGRTHSFIINGNPRAAQALNGLLEHKNDTLAGRVAASISRNMAQLCTSYNPEFVMRNMIKDFEYASTNLLTNEGLVYTKRFEQYYAKVGIIEGIRNSKLKDFADTGGFGLYAKYRNGTLDTTNKLHRYFKEFMENGGETGWVQIKNMKDFTKEYKLHIKGERSRVQKVGKGFYNAIFKNLENVNEIAENLARFATYCASRDSNRSIIRSVYDAKKVSTNFNRHGSGNAVYSFKNGEMGSFKTARRNIYGFTASWFRNGSMFFNAGIQSTNLLINNFKNNKVGTIGYIASAPFISGMAMALLNNFIISNEDEKDRNGVKNPYGELPDYIRRNNLCVYIGGGEFVTIPLAIEERAFYGLGDFAAGMTFSKNISSQKMPNLTENKDIDKYLNPFMDAVGCMSQLVPVADYLGNSSFGKHPWQETIKALAPSATSPFLEWVYNSDWKGAPIQRDNKFDENQPSWMLAYKGTPEWMINLNKKVNAQTNDVAKGNENMLGNDFLDTVTNPSALHHFYGSYFGGAATFVERVGGLIKNGKDTETKDIPFLRSLLYTPSEQSSLQRTKSKWYNYKDEMEKTMANVDRLKSKNVPIEKRISNYSDYYRFQNSKDAAKVRVIELAEKQMNQWKKLRDKSSDTESINFANQNIDRIMMEAVNDLDKLN